MKKVILRTLIASSLALMAHQSFAADQVDLRMSWWGGNGRHQVTLKAIEEFQKQYPNIKVKAEYTGWDGHLSRLTTQIAGNTEPDVMQTNWNWLPIFSRTGDGFYDLNKMKDVLDLSQFEAKELQATTVDGKLNGIPISVTARVFYYNTETWKKSGLTAPKTWDELLNAGKVFKEKLGDQSYPLVLEHQDSLALLNSYMVQKYNIPAVDEKNKKFSYTDAQWVEFFQMYKKLVDAHVMPSAKYYASFGKSNMYEMKPWITGDWGGIYMWNSTINKYSDNLQPPAKLELGAYPMLPGAKEAGLFFKPAQMLSIGKSTKHPKEAAMLINYLLNSKEGIQALGLERGVPLSKAAVAQLRADGVIKDSDPSVAGLNLALSLPHETKTSPYFDDPQIVALFGDSIQYIDYEQKSVEETAKYFQRQADRILKRAMKE
ncbi:carbohydrate ABC transporter substrate-binding protein [Dickeya dadantii]|uniref:ABC transporter substrate-binding protein n=1 Tax=Dickeya dadantii TaxID=204038 RepID=UPI001495CFF4|nr:ABC transporter substrate-binding protein [Dickeya dadantii]MCL6406786.1 carbohydrate ABC transporter substrate-binding protein [Dickeya dadantii]NPE51005.1 carbohydrate ABC transporter substrate-binding protein [Dickeya dadantii]NPE54064.1 carbohydrate ABC transporter substrate-binding protein [Dickeya dadantii]NPE66741.1 carbohydrate ABC transporter substrate-binding protein [Dickeya dadantii]